VRRALARGDLFDTAPREPTIYENGLVHAPGYLSLDQQQELLADIDKALKDAPLFQPTMPKTGKAFSVRMSNCGALGWVSDRDGGYRYQATHPVTGRRWQKIPALALEAWQKLAHYPVLPDACLINFYEVNARMGMHQDSDELDLRAPVLSLSLGASCIFRFGGTERGGKTIGLTLASGDALLLAGESRMAYHGVARIIPGTSPLSHTLIEGDGRINLTLRRVTRPS